jgi:hypothetical protein
MEIFVIENRLPVNNDMGSRQLPVTSTRGDVHEFHAKIEKTLTVRKESMPNRFKQKSVSLPAMSLKYFQPWMSIADLSIGQFTYSTVETGNELYNTAVRLRLILFSKDIGAVLDLKYSWIFSTTLQG